MIRSFGRFTLISGFGWLIDLLLTMGLVQLGLVPLIAAAIGAACAVSLVYAASLKTVFQVGGDLGVRGFPAYVVWQIVAIFVASVVVAQIAYFIEPVSQNIPAANISSLSLASGIAKGLVTPMTLLANYLFIRWLTRRLRFRQG